MNSLVGIATSYGLDVSGVESRFGQDIFFLSKTVKIDFGAHPIQWIPITRG